MDRGRSVILTVIEEVKIAAPELRGAHLELGTCRDLEICLDGPAGSGKTVAALFKIHMLLTMYPGAKALVARKTNTALAGSAVATYRDMVDIREGIRYFGGNKIRPAAFEYPNGSIMIVNGLDRPEKIKSWEYDFAYINEATEVTLEDWEFVRSRLRHGKAPYHQLIADVNPVEPTHWLNQRMNEGLTTRMLSRHEYNPRYFDLLTNDWTEEGRAYIEGVLAGLTGVRLARLRYGLWAAAEGTVYEDSYDRSRNVVSRFKIPDEWPRYLCIDFGYTHPFVCKWYAVDPDGRLICYREIYMTKRLVEDHAKDIKKYSRWGQPGGDPLPREIICDHNAEDRATLERHLGLRTTKAHKSVSDGLQAVASRLRLAGDGKPRLMHFSDALVERDPELAAAKKPCCTIDEFDVYIWDTSNGAKVGDVPKKENDHGCLVAGTLITTMHGDVPIEHIQAGDYVLTRNGYRQVKASGLTAQNAEVFTVTFSNGATLTGTGNHPIYLDKQGYTPLRAMRYGDIIMTAKQIDERLSLWGEIKANQKSSTIKELHSGVILNRLRSVCATTIAQTPVIGKLASCVSIRNCGEIHTGLSLMDTRYTTKTVTRSTTTSTIWNASQKRNIRNAMSFMKNHRVENSYGNMSHQSFRRQQKHGTLLKRVRHGIGNWEKLHGSKLNQLPEFAHGVERNSPISLLVTLRFIVQIIANQLLGVHQVSTMRHVNANNAATISLATNTAGKNIVQENVQPYRDILTLLKKREPARYVKEHLWQESAVIRSIVQEPAQVVAVSSISRNSVPQDVYNLTVENPVGEGEYFANGVLVHNCDVDRYMVARFDLKPMNVAYSNRIY